MKKKALSVEQSVIPPDGGLITRFPSNQVWRKNYSGLSVTSNVRAARGRLYSGAGYEPIFFSPDVMTNILLIYQAQLQQGSYSIMGDCSNLYAVSPAYKPIVYAGPDSVTAGYSFHFTHAMATGYLDQALGVTWSLLSGPGTATYDDAGLVTATATVTQPGLYTFQLSGTDGVFVATSTINVRFIVAFASPNFTFPTPGGGTQALTGTILGVTDPSNPVSDGSSYLWSQVSGPATVVFTSLTALNPSVTVPGTSGNYVVELTVSVGTSNYSSQITLTVPSTSDPLFAYCGTSDQWPTASSNVPYTNSGSTFAGMNNIIGSGTMSTNGTVLETSSPVNNFCVTTLPVTVEGDFTFTMEVMPNSSNAQRIGPMLYDTLTKKAYYFNASAASPSIVDFELLTYCNLIGGGGNVLQVSETMAGFLVNQWNTIVVQRTGTQISLTMNGNMALVSALLASVPVNCGIGYVTDGVDYQIRNISITQP